ncbi:MAG: hypothetical protein V4649_05770 [Bacteroidota bacterium]
MKTILLIIILAANSCCYACDCERLIGFKEAKIVFVGEVTAVMKSHFSNYQYKIIFTVNKKLKGKLKSKTVVIYTYGLDEAGCSFPFKIKDRYHIFAVQDENHLYNIACTATVKVK